MAQQGEIARLWWLKRLSALVAMVTGLVVGSHVLVSFHFARRAEAAEARWRALPVRMPEDTDGTRADLADPKNPAFHLERAIKLLPSETQAQRDWQGENWDWPPLAERDVAIIRSMAEGDAPAFAAIAEGRTAREAGGEYQWALGPMSITTPLPHLNDLRHLASHLNWSIRLAHHDGDLGAMLARAREGRELAVAAQSYGEVMVSTLVAIGIDALVLNALAECAGHVPPSRSAEEDAALWRAAREPVLAYARQALDPAFHDGLRSRSFDSEWIMVREVRTFPTGNGVSSRNVVTAPALDRAAARLSERTFATREIAIAGGPFPEVRARLDALPEDSVATNLAGVLAQHPAEMLGWGLERAIDSLYRVRLNAQATAIALALRVFEAERGRLPESLDELVPDYLPSVPVDPFDADGKPLRLIKRDGLLFIYSVGANGTDEGGDPRNEHGNAGPGRDAPDHVIPLRWDGRGDPLARLAESMK